MSNITLGLGAISNRNAVKKNIDPTELKKVQDMLHASAIMRAGSRENLKECQDEALKLVKKSIATMSHADMFDLTERSLQYAIDVIVDLLIESNYPLEEGNL